TEEDFGRWMEEMGRGALILARVDVKVEIRVQSLTRCVSARYSLSGSFCVAPNRYDPHRDVELGQMPEVPEAWDCVVKDQGDATATMHCAVI
ncbi:hypothetical protein B5M09_010647, partial [Aphanomyces astaci]